MDSSMTRFFSHDDATVETSDVGEGTRIWAFAHILAGARIGKDCNIRNNVFIENQVTLANRVTVESGVQLRDGLYAEDDVFIGPNATFCNDPFPRSKNHLASYPETRLLRGASIGANATILAGLTIGRHAMVGAGAVVTSNVPAHAVVVGNPARVVRLTDAAPMNPESSPFLSYVDLITDQRGDLMVRQVGSSLPFVPQRVFVILNVPGKHIRGDHAHKQLHQYLVALSGSVDVVLDNGLKREHVCLDTPRLGLYVPPMTWCTLYNYSPGAVVMALASDIYDANDYIRDYEVFCEMKEPEKTASKPDHFRGDHD
jgi:acetyltransferase-like isoleucine patch superfamily enzyme